MRRGFVIITDFCVSLIGVNAVSLRSCRWDRRRSLVRPAAFCLPLYWGGKWRLAVRQRVLRQSSRTEIQESRTVDCETVMLVHISGGQFVTLFLSFLLEKSNLFSCCYISSKQAILAFFYYSSLSFLIIIGIVTHRNFLLLEQFNLSILCKNILWVTLLDK